MKLCHYGIGFGLCALLAGSPALAVESLTGTWEGSIRCETLDSGIVTKVKNDQSVAIVDEGEEGVSLNLVSGHGLFLGFVVADGRKPQNGVVSGVSCNFNHEVVDGGVLQGDVKTKVGDEKASLKATLTLMDEEGDSATSCSLSVKRVSTAAPKLPVCPPL